MSERLPEVTRKSIAKGKAFRYSVDGRVHTGRSTRCYLWASVYRDGATGGFTVWLHARQDLAMKGSPDANRISQYTYIGYVEIKDEEEG